MKFKISGTPIFSENSKGRSIQNKNVITITAKGSKKIESNIEIVKELKYVKHSLYNAYLVELKSSEELEPFESTLTVKGKLGDLITVSSFFADGTDFNLCPIKNDKNGFEYTGFLKRNFKTKNCFRVKKYKANFAHNFYSWDNNQPRLSFKSEAHTEEYRVLCFDFPENAEYDEIFYTYHFELFLYQRELIKHPVSYLGVNYKRYLIENETIGLLAVQPDNDFNYLTYNLNNTYGSTKASLITCYNYPFCNISKEVFEKGTPLINYNSFSLSLNKSEFNNKITSISKTQNILLLYCDKVFKDYYCLSNQNIYSDIEVSYIVPNIIYNRYSRKNNIERFKINESYSNNIKTIYLNIEMYTGDINITINSFKYKEFSYENKKLFIINGEGIEFEFYIKSIENSAYSISYFRAENLGLFMPGANYILPLKDELNFNIKLNDNYLDSSNYKYYFDLYPIGNCSINVKRENVQNKIYEDLSEKNGFFNDIFVAKNRNSEGLAKYKLNIKEKKDDECLFYISIFTLEDEPYLHKIILNNNYSRLFLFNNDNYEMKYIYPVMDLDNDVIIDLNFVNSGRYQMSIDINDQYFAHYSIINSQQIGIFTTTLINYCDKNMNQLCKLSVNILSEENDKESILDIKIKSKIKEELPPSPIPPPVPEDETDKDKEKDKDNDKDKDKDKDDNKSFSFSTGLSIFFLIVIIALIVVIILLLKKRRKENSIDMQTLPNQEMILQE